VIGFILRLVLVLVLAVGLGAAIYFGVVYGSKALYRQYVRPVRENTSRLNTVETMRELDYEALAGRLERLQERLDALEVEDDTHEETFDSLETQLEAAESALEAVQDAQATAETSLEDVRAAQATAEAHQSAMQGTLDELTASLSALERIESELETLAAGWTETQEALGTLEADAADLDVAIAGSQDALQVLQDQLESDDTPLAGLRREVQLLRVTQLLARGRLFLNQGSPGLALQDVNAGRDILLALRSEVPAHQVATLVEMTARLDAIRENLPDAPASAAADLEIAWQLLLNGLPAAAGGAGEVISPTLEITTPVTPTATTTP
jgi:predicted  nucleic acid-binding Zn-ribbon protein